MKAIFKDKEKNTLIITEETERGGTTSKPDFREKMVLNNHIKGLLEFGVCIVDHEKRYEYDTGGLTGLEYLCIHENLNYDTVSRLLCGIRDTIQRGSKYMLDEKNYIIDPEYIWLDKEKKPMLVYHTGYGSAFSKQLEQLCEFLMNRLDYHDQKAVVLLYTLYMKSREEGFGVREFTEYLGQENAGVGKTDQPGTLSPPVKTYDHQDIYEDPGSYGAYGGYGDQSFFENDTDNSYPEENLRITRDAVQAEKTGKSDIHDLKKYLDAGSCIKAAIVIAIPAVLLFISLKLNLLTNASGKTDPLKLGAVLILGAAVGWYITKKLPASLFEKKTDGNKKASVNFPGMRTQKTTAVHDKEEITELLSDAGEETELLFSLDNENNVPKRAVLVSDSYPRIVADTFPFYIGKDEAHMDFCLNATGVSRYHLKLDHIGDALFAYDLNSKNGSYVNNIRIEASRPVKLFKGDRIKIGLCEYRLE